MQMTALLYFEESRWRSWRKSHSWTLSKCSNGARITIFSYNTTNSKIVVFTAKLKWRVDERLVLDKRTDGVVWLLEVSESLLISIWRGMSTLIRCAIDCHMLSKPKGIWEKTAGRPFLWRLFMGLVLLHDVVSCLGEQFHESVMNGVTPENGSRVHIAWFCGVYRENGITCCRRSLI